MSQPPGNGHCVGGCNRLSIIWEGVLAGRLPNWLAPWPGAEPGPSVLWFAIILIDGAHRTVLRMTAPSRVTVLFPRPTYLPAHHYRRRWDGARGKRRNGTSGPLEPDQ